MSLNSERSIVYFRFLLILKLIKTNLKERSDDEAILLLIDAGVDTVIPMKDTDLANLKDVFKNLF